MDYQTDSGELVNFLISQYIYVLHDQILTDEVRFVVYHIWGPFGEAIQSIFVKKNNKNMKNKKCKLHEGRGQTTACIIILV